MIIPELAYTGIEKLVKSFKEMPAYMDEEGDKRVYVLYGLTEEETKIVEGK